MQTASIGKARVTRVCIGGNQFSGFSHQGRDQEMRDYHTPEQIGEVLKTAEEAGINTFFSRTDDHIFGVVRRHWESGGKLQWFAQISQDKGDPESWRKWLKAAIELGATGTYLHGGATDHWHANNMHDHFREALDMMREGGTVAGFAGHSPDAHDWLNENLDVDFQMCCHYNPTDRSHSPHHQSVGEKWREEDRERMLQTTARIRKSVVHYKVFAGGNKPVVPAFKLLGKVMKPDDIVLLGFFLKDNPNMITEDIALFERHVEGR